MITENRETLIRCFCETRKTQAFLVRCLNQNTSEEDEEFLMELIKETSLISKRIEKYCKKK